MISFLAGMLMSFLESYGNSTENILFQHSLPMAYNILHVPNIYLCFKSFDKIWAKIGSFPFEINNIFKPTQFKLLGKLDQSPSVRWLYVVSVFAINFNAIFVNRATKKNILHSHNSIILVV